MNESEKTQEKLFPGTSWPLEILRCLKKGLVSRAGHACMGLIHWNDVIRFFHFGSSGSSINHVVKFLGIFDPHLPFVITFTRYGLGICIIKGSF